MTKAESLHPPVDICIVTQLHLSLNPRVVKEADALTEAGFSVAVIAPDYSAFGNEADRAFCDRPWKIVERPKFGPRSPIFTRTLELVRRSAADIAVGKFGITHPIALHAAWHPVAPLLIAAARRQPASLYIGHLVGLPAAALAAAHHGAKYAYDAEDFHPGDLPDTPENAVANGLVRQIEERYLPGCTYMTAASPGIADAYAAEYGIPRPTVILNTFPTSNAPLCSTPAGSARPGPSIYWYSQTIGNDRGLQSAIRAIALSSYRPHLYLRGDCSPVFAAELRKLARDHGVEDQLHFLPLAAPQEMEKLASVYDLGLCGEIGHTENRRIALTNKQFTYLLAGLPVLMSDISAHVAFATKAEGAVELFKVDDTVSLAKAIDRTLADPNRLAEMRFTAWKLGHTRYNWKVDAKILVELVQLAVKPSTTSDSAPIGASC